jgi:hypothetical protein
MVNKEWSDIVDFLSQRLYPVFLEDLLSIISSIDAQYYDGLAARPAQVGIEVMDVDARVFQGAQDRIHAAGMVWRFHGKHIRFLRSEATTFQDVESLHRVISDKTDRAHIGGVGNGYGPNVDAFPSQELTHIGERAGRIVKNDRNLSDYHKSLLPHVVKASLERCFVQLRQLSLSFTENLLEVVDEKIERYHVAHPHEGPQHDHVSYLS